MGNLVQVLIGYMAEATNAVDFGIDGLSYGNQSSTLYSILDSKKVDHSEVEHFLFQ